jgi:hypothetical protein
MKDDVKGSFPNTAVYSLGYSLPFQVYTTTSLGTLRPDDTRKERTQAKEDLPVYADFVFNFYHKSPSGQN